MYGSPIQRYVYFTLNAKPTPGRELKRRGSELKAADQAAGFDESGVRTCWLRSGHSGVLLLPASLTCSNVTRGSWLANVRNRTITSLLLQMAAHY